MKIEQSQVTKIHITEAPNLDPIHVYIEDVAPAQGRIVISVFGKAWSAYWSSMGAGNTLSDFFCSCDEHYIAKNLSTIDSTVFDLDAMREAADKKGIEHYRDDLDKDWGFLEKMYGSDSAEWGDLMPKMKNYEYTYLCRIILAIQEAMKEIKS